MNSRKKNYAILICCSIIFFAACSSDSKIEEPIVIDNTEENTDNPVQDPENPTPQEVNDRITVYSTHRVASLVMEEEEYQEWIDNEQFGTAKLQELTQELYQNFDDNFDFIFLILNEDNRPSGLPAGQNINVSNAVSGINKAIFDNTADYGSAGKLKAVMHLTRRSDLLYGPSLHEIVHTWANFGIPTESVSGTGINLSSYSYIPHWGFTGGSKRGQLGGFEQSSLVVNGGNSYTVDSFGAFANGGNSVPYTQMELYLMGLIPLTEVDDFDTFLNINSLEKSGGKSTFVAETRIIYDQARIESLLGPRSPASDTSQKDFSVLVVVLSDSALTDDEWAALDSHVETFTKNEADPSIYNFWEATGGRGSLEVGSMP